MVPAAIRRLSGRPRDVTGVAGQIGESSGAPLPSGAISISLRKGTSPAGAPVSIHW